MATGESETWRRRLRDGANVPALHAQETAMKKTILIWAVLFLGATLTAQSDAVQKPRKLNIRTAYTYQDESLLVSLADLYGSFVISPGIDDSIRIVGAEQLDFDRSIFTRGDLVFINEGASAGIREGDRFQVVSRGGKIPDPFSVGSLGTYYRFRGEAVVTCVYPDRAVVELVNAPSPAEIGHFLLSFEKQEPVYRRQLKYLDSRLPDAGVRGRVVYLDIEQDVPREIASSGDMVAVNLGRDVARRGDLVLFYKYVKPDLPPVIVGTGIVVYPQNTNSTVKILDGGYPVELGHHVALLPESEVEAAPISTEEIPILDKLKQEERPQKTSEVSEFSVDLLFDLDSAELSEAATADLDKAARFLEGKSEYMVVLKGYTCSIGNEEYNLKLSQQRVEAVKEYMKNRMNIGDEFFDTNFYGESEATFDNSVEAQRRLNRRVSLKIMAR
ncbi:MAG TPA: hypothetical protein ENN40_07625 [Candidatus Aminicenantes bacterium]|nr:hypothetical protein [Candidatus Aminicenantes bacterium]